MEKIRDKSGSFPYEMGLLSYVPLIGFIFGVVSIIWRPLTRSTGGKVPFFLGLGGIVVNLILSGLVYYGFYHGRVAFHIEDKSLHVLLIKLSSHFIFLLMILIALVTFIISFLSFVLKRRLLYFKGALFGIMLWASLIYLAHLDDYGFFDIGIPSGESGLVFIGLLLMAAPGFVIAGIVTAYLIKKLPIDSQP